jgi:hypothetical protein
MILFIEQVVGPDWIIRSGTVLTLDPIREANWVASGRAMFWDDADDGTFLDGVMDRLRSDDPATRQGAYEQLDRHLREQSEHYQILRDHRDAANEQGDE